MKMLSGISLTIMILGLSQVVLAQPSTSGAIQVEGSNPSALPPGARIVAGDLSKNEFFILAGNTPAASTKKEITAPQTQVAATKTMKLFVHRTLANAATHKHVATKTSSHKRSNHKSIIAHKSISGHKHGLTHVVLNHGVRKHLSRKGQITKSKKLITLQQHKHHSTTVKS